MPGVALTSARRLDVYQASLRFAAAAFVIQSPASASDLGDQIRRAASSIVLNLAEGAGEFRPREKRRFYRMAYRSANECSAVLDLLELSRCRVPNEARHELTTVLRMLVRLCQS